MPNYIHCIACVLLLSACAAEVGKDKSGDLQAENTKLKVENTRLSLEHDAAVRERDVCYKRAGSGQ